MAELAWYWWLLIVIALVGGTYVKLTLLKNMTAKKDVTVKEDQI